MNAKRIFLTLIVTGILTLQVIGVGAQSQGRENSTPVLAKARGKVVVARRSSDEVPYHPENAIQRGLDAEQTQAPSNETAHPPDGQSGINSTLTTADCIPGFPNCRPPSQDPIVGAWVTSIIPAKDSGLAPFVGVQIFHADGTTIATDTLQYVPPMGTDQFGSWVRLGGREYAYTLLLLLTNDQGDFLGTVKIRSTATLSESGNEITSQDTNEFFGADGKLIPDQSFDSATKYKRIVVERR